MYHPGDRGERQALESRNPPSAPPRTRQGQQVVGAIVGIADLNLAVYTGANGAYTLTIAGDRVRGQEVAVKARAFGFKPASKSITVTAGQQTVDFTLPLDVNLLEAVVVTGTVDATERVKVPFSVTRIDVAHLPVPSVNPISEIQGKVPGAEIVSTSGRPGSQPEVLLRGPRSINGSDRGQGPLYILDGVILNGRLPDINPLDIESVEIVKGAAGSSRYGARGGNGVIQITTKSGKTAIEGVSFNARSEAGWSDIERKIQIAQRTPMVLDETNQRFCINVTGQALCSATIDYAAEQARINNVPGDFSPTPVGFPVDPGGATNQGGRVNGQVFQVNPWPGQTYDAVGQFVKPHLYTQNSLEATGRVGQTNFFASGSFLDEQGAIRFLKGFRRYSGRLNVDQRIGSAWSLGFRTYYSRDLGDGANQENINGTFFRLTRVPAIVNLLQRDTLGRLYIRPNLQASGQQNQNPLYSLENEKREDINDRFIGGLTVQYTPLNWLSVDGNFSYDFSKGTFEQFDDKGFRTTSSQPGGSICFPYCNNGGIYSGALGGESYNTSVHLTVRRNLARDLVGRTTLGSSYDQQDSHLRRMQGDFLAVQGVQSVDNVTLDQSITSTFTSVRLLGFNAAASLEYKERYIVDGSVSRQGSSLFGSANRWATFGRGSAAWRVAQEPWWFAPNVINELKLRASHGSSGGRPNFAAQYETYTFASGGVLVPGTLGNRNLRPEVTTETEAGVDLEAFKRVGVSVTYSLANTRDQILPVPAPASTGFASQWKNAGTLQNKTWELSLNLPIILKRDVSWSVGFIYDRNRNRITKLDVAPFNIGTPSQATGAIIRIQEGLPYGTFFGRKFLTDCSELPAPFNADCGGPTSSFQTNDDGWLVWVGSGNTWQDGITKNLWATKLLGPSAPWGVQLNWGLPIVLRDNTQAAVQVPLGQPGDTATALPRFHFAVTQTFQWKRLTVYGLLDANIGQYVWNQARSWSYLDLLNRDVDQDGKTVATAKPIGYYWRAPPPDNSNGIGGLYDILGPNNNNMEKASYAKLREASVSYHVGPVGGVGDWSVTAIGRNLFTITKYKGFDPEVGIGSVGGPIPGRTSATAASGDAGSAAINAIDAFTFPNVRSVTFGLSTNF